MKAHKRLQTRGRGRLMVRIEALAGNKAREVCYFQRSHDLPPNTVVDQPCGGYFHDKVMIAHADK